MQWQPKDESDYNRVPLFSYVVPPVLELTMKLTRQPQNQIHLLIKGVYLCLANMTIIIFD